MAGKIIYKDVGELVQKRVLDGDEKLPVTGDEYITPDQIVEGTQQLITDLSLEVDGKYVKPADGIPGSDLSQRVQASLGKADTAYQKPGAGIPKIDMTPSVQMSLNMADSAYQKPASGISKNDLAQSVQNSLGLADTALQSADLTPITNLIPAQASAQNQLADKEFVNSSIATSTATFRGTFNSVEALNAYSGEKDINDYAFVSGVDSAGNTLYSRYKYNGTSWAFEYALNNSSFTAEQWAAINSGVSSEEISEILQDLGSKQDTIADLSTIRSGAAAGAEAAYREYDSENPSGLGYKVLDKETFFSSQVTDANTIYEIRYDFDLGDGSVTIPAGCVLKFNGGSISNGDIVANGTLLDGDVRILAEISGTVLNDEVKVSWFNSGDTSLNEAIFVSFCRLATKPVVLVDEDITLNGGTYNTALTNLQLKGEGHTITNCCYCHTTGDVLIENVRFEGFTSSGILLYNDDTNEINITIRGCYLDGEGYVSRVLYGGNSTNVVLDITDNEITAISEMAINCNNYVTGRISRNYIHDFGGTGAKVGGVFIGRDQYYYAHDCEITENRIINLLCSFSSTNDGREAHGVIVYGDRNLVSHNYIDKIYSIVSDAESQPGYDAEGIYIKGSYNTVSDNYLNNAVGSNSDGSITLKGTASNTGNSVLDNTVMAPYGTGIYTLLHETTITGNKVFTEKRVGINLSSGSRASNNVIVEGNRVECLNGDGSNAISGILCYNHPGAIIRNNTIIGFNESIYAVTSDSINVSYNKIILSNRNFSGYSDGIQHLHLYSSPNATFTDNEFIFEGVNFSGWYFLYPQSSGGLAFSGNTIRFKDYDDNGTTVHCAGTRIFRVGSQVIENNFFEIDYLNGLTLFSSSYTSTVCRYNVFKASALPGFGGIHYGNMLYSDNYVGTTAPTGVETGMLFYDTSVGKMKVYNGTSWVEIASTSDVPEPNGEDIDLDVSGKLELANRAYNTTTPNGLGYKILRKESTFASQVTDTNTIYEIRYDYDLDSGDVTIPAGCTLRFNGGKVSNGTITLSRTILDGDVKLGCSLAGTRGNEEFFISWFGITPTYTLTTEPNDVLVNTDAQATAEENADILNDIVIPSLNTIGGTLIVDRTFWINDQLSRIYNFNLKCDREIYYIGDDDIDGGILEIGGSLLEHTVRIINNRRHSILANPEYYTNGAWDADKAYEARKDFGIIGVLVRDSNRTTINIEDVKHFTTGVMVAGGYGSNNANNFVSYETINLNNIESCYRGIVFNIDTGWMTECTVNKGRIWCSSSEAFAGHVYAITFESSNQTQPGSNNMVFNQPCVEGAYCGLHIDNVAIGGCVFNDVRDEGVTNRIIEESNVVNTLIRKAIYTSYNGFNANEIQYKSVIIKNNNSLSVASDVIDVNLQTIYGTLDANNQTTMWAVKDMFLLSQNNKLGDSYTSLTFKSTVYPDDNIVSHHAYGFPVLVFDNGIGSTNFSFTLRLDGKMEGTPQAYVAFFDASGNAITDGISAPYSFYIQYGRFALGVSNVLTVARFSIPNTIKKIAFGVTGVSHYQIFISSRQSIVKGNDYFRFPENPSGGVNCNYANLQYYNTNLHKSVQHFGDRWITEDAYNAVATAGASSARPADLADKDLNNKGFVYYDTTLNKPIYYRTSQSTAMSYTNAGKTGTKELGANTLVEGNKYYVRVTQGGVDDTQTFYFTKAVGSLTDAIAYPLLNPTLASGTFYTRETELFTAPDASVYPYMALVISSTSASYKFTAIFNISESWEEYAPTISTDISTDAASDAKTASPKAVADYAVQSLTSGGKKIWAGTQAEYDLLTPSNDTLYFIKSS